MDILGVLVALAIVFVALFGGPILALVALTRGNRVRDRVDALERQLARVDALERQLARVKAAVREEGPAAAAPAPPAAEVPSVAPAPVAAEPAPLAAEPAPLAAEPQPTTTGGGEPQPAAGPSPVPVAATSRIPRPAARPASPPSPPQVQDFATNLGPKILVGMGSLAFVVFLGLFVKYAWDQNWVGPVGRVLFGALVGVGLVAAGLRLLGREYRPLGQGLAATGVAALYVSAFAAHGFYDLVSAQVAGLFMVAITANAVLIAARLDARLLATLAWVGGYLTPVLLSTGEDKVLALYLYLLLLDVGALVLDHKKPWPETLPLALFGTLALYAGWYAQFFSAERFTVAALGVVLFTALFVFGMARKERTMGLGAVMLLGSGGLGLLARIDRPETLILLSLGFAALTLRLATGVGWVFPLVGTVAVGLPFLVWSSQHYSAFSFGIAAAWLLAGILILTRPALLGAPGVPIPFEGGVLAVGGLAVAGLASTHGLGPLTVSATLLAYGAMCVLARTRWAFSELVGVGVAALAVLPRLDGHLDPLHAWEGWVVGLPIAALFVLSLIVRGVFVRKELLDLPDVLTHLAAASLLWAVVYRILDRTAPALLGPAAAGLALAYLALGLALRREGSLDVRQIRVLLGLAAGFLTLAIPVQLGLHGITLGWAAEGLLLLWLGLRYASPLLRAAGYAILSLALFRLLGWHLPLHGPEPFTPVVNASFGTWMAIIVATGAAVWLAHGARREGHRLDLALAPILSVVALVLLFGLFTGEVQHTFAQKTAAALRAADPAAAQDARRLGGLAVSLLWTAFATSLLAGGLGLRNRPLFYGGYGLFALTAGKVVFWDLDTSSLPYRMLAFLGLAVLLMAGAYLNLRFRARLLPREEAT